MPFGIRGIEESSTYKAVIRRRELEAEDYAEALAAGYDEDFARTFASGYAKGYMVGRLEEAREFLIFLGRKRFGPPDEQAEAKIAALNDLDRLHELGARILDVASWNELLADPSNEPE